jgi:hypothetical protein
MVLMIVRALPLPAGKTTPEAETNSEFNQARIQSKDARGRA